jgi:hypothetical protein
MPRADAWQAAADPPLNGLQMRKSVLAGVASRYPEFDPVRLVRHPAGWLAVVVSCVAHGWHTPALGQRSWYVPESLSCSARRRCKMQETVGNRKAPVIVWS